MKFDFFDGKSQKGAFLVLAAILIPVFLMLASLAVDLGKVWAYHSKMQNAADAAALAGASHFSGDDQIKDRIDSSNHPNADKLAKAYLKMNLGNQEVQARYLARVVTDSVTNQTESYYRVEVTRPIPLTFANIIDIANFDVKAAAVAKIGRSENKVESSPLIAARDGVIGNLNSDNINQINSTFDGDVVVADKNFYDSHLNEDKYKFFIGKALHKDRRDVSSTEWYKTLQYTATSNYDNGAATTEASIRQLMNENQPGINSNSMDLWSGNNFTIPFQKRDFYDYYYLTTNANDIDINLYAIHGDENKPVYIFIDGNRGQVQVNLQSNSVRPVIFCDLSNTGKYSYTDWQGQKVTEYYSKFKLHANGYTFKGVVFAPYSQAFVNFDGPSTFILDSRDT